MKTVGRVAETRLTVEKLSKGHNSGKNQSSINSIKYAHLQVMGIITGKFHQNPLKTVGIVAETRLCLRADGRTDKPITIVPFDLRRGTITMYLGLNIIIKLKFTTIFDRCALLNVLNYLTKDFES